MGEAIFQNFNFLEGGVGGTAFYYKVSVNSIMKIEADVKPSPHDSSCVVNISI